MSLGSLAAASIPLPRVALHQGISSAPASVRPWTSCHSTRAALGGNTLTFQLVRRGLPLPAAAGASEATTASGASEAATASAEPTLHAHSWLWEGHRINYVVAGSGKPVVLLHGFGASVGHFRKNIPVLAAAGYKVYAFDLLGFGASDKPPLGWTQTGYAMEGWSSQIQAFLDEFVEEPAVLVGNSIGSLAALMAAASAPDQVSGVCLLNCAGGMNNKSVAEDWRVKLAMPLFLLIDWLLAQPKLARYLFDKFRTKDNIRKVLKGVYPLNPGAVDDALVDLLHGPGEDQGALETFCSILSGPPGPRPEALVPQLGERPCLVLWGTNDVFTPSDGPIGRWFRRSPNVQFVDLPGLGHCPHDEQPEAVHQHLLPWLERVHRV